MAATDSTPNPTAQQPGGAAPPTIDALFTRVNEHAASRNWGPNRSDGVRKQMVDLAAIGASYVEGMGNLPAGGLTDAQMTEIAQGILKQNTQAQKIKANMQQNRSGLIGGTVKASGSALGGAAQGALIGTVLAVASRPLNWLLKGVTGGKVSVQGKSLIALGAAFYAGKNILASLSNSYVEPGRHNKTVDEMSLDAVKVGIAKAAAARTQAPGQPASSIETAQVSPASASPASDAHTVANETPVNPSLAVVPAAMASTVVASSSEVPTAPAADIAQKVQAALDQVKELPRGAKLPVENVVAVNFAPEKTPEMDKPAQITI